MLSVCASESQIETKSFQMLVFSESRDGSFAKGAFSMLRCFKMVRIGALGGVLRFTWVHSGRSWEALRAILGALGVLLECFERSRE